ncbi:UNVERIFIED_CONTAM: hypothetical protein Slati_0528100 [Sesamum latifolium]|uniref:DUF4220 domain-containing protein n=1 Tax=Sesamum latifolium TaxID=2727402 RepID=A0AAW2XY83_9LAMI
MLSTGSSWLPVLSILIFVAGLIKYGERLFALFASNSENFRDSMVTEPDPGPNYAKFMEEFTLKKAEGFYVEAAEVIEIPVPAQPSFPNDNGKLIPEAYELFLKFKCLFADAILSFQDRDSSQHYFHQLEPRQAFDVVEVELGFVFDELYKKHLSCIKLEALFSNDHFIFNFLCLDGFCLPLRDEQVQERDLVITYMLLVVAICLEIYAVWVLINSDWTENWLSRRERTTYSSLIIRWFQRSNKRRWSKKMAQHNLLDLCVRGKSAIRLRNQKFLWKIRKLSWVDNYLEKHWYKTFVDVSPELKDLIFSELARVNEHDSTAFNRRGSFTLEKYGNLHLDWTQEVEFDQRILLWHIATDICYAMEWGDDEEPNRTERKQMSDHSKHISDYMLYLLIACPFMLPIGIGMIRFRDTCAEAKEFLEERNVRFAKPQHARSCSR